MASGVSFRNLDHVFAAAELEAKLMENCVQEEVISTPSAESQAEGCMQNVESEVAPMLEVAPELERGTVDSVGVMPSISKADVQQALTNTNIASALKRIAENPDEVKTMMEQSMKQMTPEAMDQARKLAMGGQGDQIRKEMARRGMDPNMMRKQFLEQQRALRGAASVAPVDATSMILITTGRQLKSKNISQSSVNITAATLLHATTPVELACSRLAKGPLTGKSIKVWYDPNNPVRNRRATKIIGFPVGGDMLVLIENSHLTEKDFLAAEKFLA